MKTFVSICRLIKSGKDRGYVYGDFDKIHVRYALLSHLKEHNKK